MGQKSRSKKQKSKPVVQQKATSPVFVAGPAPAAERPSLVGSSATFQPRTPVGLQLGVAPQDVRRIAGLLLVVVVAFAALAILNGTTNLTLQIGQQIARFTGL